MLTSSLLLTLQCLQLPITHSMPLLLNPQEHPLTFQITCQCLLPSHLSNCENLCSWCDIISSTVLLTVKLACLFSYLPTLFLPEHFVFIRKLLFYNHLLLNLQCAFTYDIPLAPHDQPLRHLPNWSFYLQTCPLQFFSFSFLLEASFRKNKSIHITPCLKPFSVYTHVHRILLFSTF